VPARNSPPVRHCAVGVQGKKAKEARRVAREAAQLDGNVGDGVYMVSDSSHVCCLSRRLIALTAVMYASPIAACRRRCRCCFIVPCMQRHFPVQDTPLQPHPGHGPCNMYVL